MNQLIYRFMPTGEEAEAFQFFDPLIDSTGDHTRAYPRWMILALTDGSIRYDPRSKAWRLCQTQVSTLVHKDWIVRFNGQPLEAWSEEEFKIDFERKEVKEDEVDSGVRVDESRLSGDGGT